MRIDFRGIWVTAWVYSGAGRGTEFGYGHQRLILVSTWDLMNLAMDWSVRGFCLRISTVTAVVFMFFAPHKSRYGPLSWGNKLLGSIRFEWPSETQPGNWCPVAFTKGTENSPAMGEG